MAKPRVWPGVNVLLRPDFCVLAGHPTSALCLPGRSVPAVSLGMSNPANGFKQLHTWSQQNEGADSALGREFKSFPLQDAASEHHPLDKEPLTAYTRSMLHLSLLQAM